jgi:hypothetical protein
LISWVLLPGSDFFLWCKEFLLRYQISVLFIFTAFIFGYLFGCGNLGV